MFIISITYKVDLNIVDKFLESHIEFLDKYFKSNIFLLSGRKNPRIGGIIIADNVTENEVNEIIKEDSFYINNIANYEITEFTPSRFNEKIKFK